MIYFASRTNKVRSLVERLSFPSTEITDELTVTAPFLLVTYTDGIGQVPDVVDRFMKRNYKFCAGVVASGNIGFNANFAFAAERIHYTYSIPIVCKVDLCGTTEDIATIQQFYQKHIRGEHN